MYSIHTFSVTSCIFCRIKRNIEIYCVKSPLKEDQRENHFRPQCAPMLFDKSEHIDYEEVNRGSMRDCMGRKKRMFSEVVDKLLFPRHVSRLPYAGERLTGYGKNQKQKKERERKKGSSATTLPYFHEQVPGVVSACTWIVMHPGVSLRPWLQGRARQGLPRSCRIEFFEQTRVLSPSVNPTYNDDKKNRIALEPSLSFSLLFPIAAYLRSQGMTKDLNNLSWTFTWNSLKGSLLLLQYV